MKLETYITYHPIDEVYEVDWCDLETSTEYETFTVSEEDLLDYIVEHGLNTIYPSPQEDFAPYTINVKRALEEFETDIIEHYIQTIYGKTVS